MAINEATIGRVKYFPEQLPDSIVTDIGATSEVTPAILDVRQFPPLLVRLSEIAVDQEDNVEMRFKVDARTFSPLTGSMFDLDTEGSKVNNFSLLARDRIYYNLYNSGALQEDFKTYYSLWVIKPTIAHKLRLGIPLTPDEQKLNRDLGISATVEKGLLPLPLNEQISREFQVLQEETHGFKVNVPDVGVPVETLHPAPGQFFVLTKLTAFCSDGALVVGDNIRIAIDRDYVTDYVEFPIWPLGTTKAKALSHEISCFIPATTELRVKLKATTGRNDVSIRFTVLKVAMTNIFRARWGLASPDELPGDVYNKVLAGVL
ncbi:hypothetical protein ES707_11876 [subsurface metagenome]